MRRTEESCLNRNVRRCALRIVLVLYLSAVGSHSLAQQDIYRCVAVDGSVAFQETPCPVPEEDTESVGDETPDDTLAGDDFFDFVNPYDEPVDESNGGTVDEAAARNEAPLPPPVSENRAECEKLTRDAIDAIDLEMRKGYTPEEGENYKLMLIELTRQLRSCKQLQ